MYLFKITLKFITQKYEIVVYSYYILHLVQIYVELCKSLNKQINCFN